MAKLAQQIIDNQRQAASTQQTLRNKRRVIRQPVVPSELSAESAPPVALNTPEAVAPENSQTVAQGVTLSSTAITVSPLDLPTEQFSAGLDRRKQNRQLLMQWLRTALIEGTDYGRIHVVSRDRCQYAKSGHAKTCPDPSHWSKPSLFKPGAEKITGMLGMTVHYPSLPAYEDAVLAQVELGMIVLRCELRDAHGHVVAEGVGARSAIQDYGDINKSFKMAEKSAHIDATLRMAGLSEVFTQDLEDWTAAVEAVQTVAAAVPAPVRREDKPKSSISAGPKVKIKANVAGSAPAVEAKGAGELVSAADIESLRKDIASHGFTEKRVLMWLSKFTHGAVTQFDQLPLALFVSLAKRLDQWAEAEKFFSNSATEERGSA